MHEPDFIQLAADHGLHGDSRTLWKHCAHLSDAEIRLMFSSFFMAKESERKGVIWLLDSAVPLAYAAEVGCDPRYAFSPPRGYYGTADTIALHKGGVPIEYAVAVGELHKPGIEIVALHEAHVPAEYVLAAGDVPGGVVIRGWEADVAPEYVGSLA